MTLARIYLADKESGKWVPLLEAPHNSENMVEPALASSPELIPGEQINPTKPRRWLLVRPGTVDNAGGKQALFLVDQNAIPTYVICQEAGGSADQQGLLATMIQQATQGTSGLLGEKVRNIAVETAAELGHSLEEELNKLLGGEPDEAAFWAAVEHNLQKRRLRMIFVAGQISGGFLQMLDFLDQTMSDVEVLALEIKQYRAGDQTALVPQFVDLGERASHQPSEPSPVLVKPEKPLAAVAAAPEVKPSVPAVPELQKNGKNGSKSSQKSTPNDKGGSEWGESTFFKDLSGHTEEAQVLAAWQIFNWARKNATRIEWGGGSTRGIYAPVFSENSRQCQLFKVMSNGWVELDLSGYKTHPPFNTVPKMEQFFAYLRAIEEMDLPEDALQKRALLPLRLFTVPSQLAKFLKVFEWAMVNMRTNTGILENSTAELQSTIGELELNIDGLETNIDQDETLKKWKSRRKPRVLWPQSEPLSENIPDDDGSGAGFRTYESSFDELLSRKRVELDDDEESEDLS